MVGLEQRKESPVSVFTKRKPPAAAFAVPDLATSGRFTRAVLVPVFVMTEPGDTPTSEMPAESHAGKMPGPVVKVKAPSAGTSSAVAGELTPTASKVEASRPPAKARIDVRRMVGTPSAGKQIASG